MTSEEYEEIRANPARFAVRHGHEDPELETVVEERVGYTLVEQEGAAATYVTRVDPRTTHAEGLRRRPRTPPPGSGDA